MNKIKRSVLALPVVAASIAISGCSSEMSDLKASDSLSVELATPVFYPEVTGLKEVKGGASSHAVLGGLVSWTKNSGQDAFTPRGSLFWGVISWGEIRTVDGVDYTRSLAVADYSGDELLARERAASNALATGKCDVILAPLYSINKRNYVLYSEVSVNVKGTGAVVSEIKPTGKVSDHAKACPPQNRNQGMFSKIL